MSHAPWNEPFERFAKIFDEAKKVISKDPNAMSLATVDERGQPQVRIVLLKELDARGFVFFTNGESWKAQAIDRTHRAGINFYWPQLDQQVRVEGTVEHVTAAESDAYFATRPRVSQLGAWASHQSRALDARETLEKRLADYTRQYEGKTVPRPPHWGGFRLLPERIEFWKAHEFRLHWREQYVKSGDDWDRGWLNP
ncbi:MAG: pyridoxamine 5'-phosphate oxidase [Archangium sp.]|nr:pyridoxamine 5'-phosphate oxidase [Archangium sp.]